MNKTQLIEKAVKAGLDSSGTVKQLKDRLKAYSLEEKPVVETRIERNPDRENYRNSAHTPKDRKGARNLQVKSDDEG